MHHLTFDLDNLGIHSEYTGPEEVTIGNGSWISISYVSSSTSDCKFVLNDILHVLDAHQNILFVSSFVKSNQVSIEFFLDFFLIKDLVTKATLYKGHSRDGLYSFQPEFSSIKSFAASLSTWHARLGHASTTTVCRVLESSDISFGSSSNSSICLACSISKSHKLSFWHSSFKASGLLDLVCSDLWGPTPIVSNDGFHYYVIFYDHYSKYTWIYFLKLKSNVIDAFKQF
jgi:hypothetical protein